jgi:hypothetical protein
LAISTDCISCHCIRITIVELFVIESVTLGFYESIYNDNRSIDYCAELFFGNFGPNSIPRIHSSNTLKIAGNFEKQVD